MQCKQCEIDKKDDELVLSIMSKLGLELLVFIPTFYSERLENTNLWITSLDAFAKYLIHEQSKLIQMWALKASKNQARLAGETKNAQ